MSTYERNWGITSTYLSSILIEAAAAIIELPISSEFCKHFLPGGNAYSRRLEKLVRLQSAITPERLIRDNLNIQRESIAKLAEQIVLANNRAGNLISAGKAGMLVNNSGKKSCHRESCHARIKSVFVTGHTLAASGGKPFQEFGMSRYFPSDHRRPNSYALI